MTFTIRTTHRSPLRAALALAGVAAALTLVGCTSPGSLAPEEESTVPADATIDTTTPVGERAQWIVDVLNADEDTTVEQWSPVLHGSFTAEVSPEELTELINTSMRPAKPFTVAEYRGTETESVTTLENPLTDPLDMQLVIDEHEQIVGLFFGPSSAG